MKVTYVITTYGKHNFLFNCLLSFRKYHPEDECIVIDNGGPDMATTRELCSMFKAKFGMVPKNGSLSKVMNDGVDHAKTDYVCICNNDIIFTRRLTEQFESDFEKDEKIVMVGGLLYYPDGHIQHGGGYRRWNEKQMGHYGHGKAVKHAGLCLIPAYRIYVTGAMAAIRKSFWEKEKYDVDLAMSCEDTDICFRAWKSGNRVFYDPEITAIHVEGATRGRTPADKKVKDPEAMAIEEKSTELFKAKHTEDEMWEMDKALNKLNLELHPELPRAFVRHSGLGDVLRSIPFYRTFEERERKGVVVITHAAECFKNENPLRLTTEIDEYAVSDFFNLDLAYERRQHLSIDEAYDEAMVELIGQSYVIEPVQKISSTSFDTMILQRISDQDWSKPYVVIHAKSAPRGKALAPWVWHEVIKWLNENGYIVDLIGDPQDYQFTGKDIVNLNGRTSLSTMHALMSKAALYIGMDSGPMHLAEGVCPTIGIFTFTDPDKLVSKEVHRVITPAPCRGCHHRRPKGNVSYGCEYAETDPREYCCTATIRPELIINKIREVLKIES